MDDREARWKNSEAELNRIHAMTGLDREMCARRGEELLAEQDVIEFELGFENSVHKRTRGYSGLR